MSSSQILVSVVIIFFLWNRQLRRRGAIINIVPETLLSYMGDRLQNKQLYMSLQEYGLFWLQGN